MTQSKTSRLLPKDILRTGASGPLARKARTALSALGVSIGIAALVGVLGLSESSKSALLDEISALGTDLLTVQAGEGFGQGNAALPETSLDSVRRANNVESASSIIGVDASVLKSEFIPSGETGGIQVAASDERLLQTLNGEIATGKFLDDATSRYPAVVLGSVAAERLGIRDLTASPFIFVGETYVEVIGILEPFPGAADLDRSAIMGTVAAQDFFGADVAPNQIFVRVEDGMVDDVRGLLPETVDPASPEEVTIDRPTDLLEAEAATNDTLTTLFLGLGVVALLVGGIGIANVMVIAVIERRGEIGLRRALGATESHIRNQFLTEAVILSALGGLVGVVIGVVATFGYSIIQGWRVIIPIEAVIGGPVAAIIIGTIAGLYPAIRAARLAPTDALRS